MTTPLDILFIESHDGAGDSSAAALLDAGHRLHRCHHSGDSAWACVGLSDPGSCPVGGHIDAAVLVRHPDAGEPTHAEDGVRCALRARIPLVGVGVGDESVYAQWVTLRTHERALDAACHAAIELAQASLVEEVLGRIGPLVTGTGLDARDARCTVAPHGSTLNVHITLPGPADRRLEQAVAVRAYDVLRNRAEGYATVDVAVKTSPDEHELIQAGCGAR